AIGLGERQRPEIAAGGPPHPLTKLRHRISGQRRGEEVQLDGSLSIDVSCHEDRSPHRALDGELFHQLSGEADLERLARLAFAAGEFPGAGQVRPLEPPCQQKTIAPLDDRRRDDYDAVEGHRRRSGHSEQRGVRAEQTVAPKSISAWLKSKTCARGSTVSDTRQRCCTIACAFGLPRATNTRNSTRATLVSRMAARSRKAKLRM